MRWRNHLANMASLVDLTVQAVTARSRFVHAVEPSVTIAKLLEHRRNGIWRVADFSEEAGRTGRFGIRNGEAEVGVKIHLVRLLVHEDRCRIGATLVQ